MICFRWFVAALTLVALFGLYVTNVSAHAYIVKSEPAEGTIVATAPSEVKLWFGEGLEPRFSSAYLVDFLNGTRIQTGPSAVSPTDPHVDDAAVAHPG